MSGDKRAARLHTYVFGKLTDTEHREMMQDAFEDQSAFDDLMEAADERTFLQDSECRRQVLQTLGQLEAPPAWWRRIRLSLPSPPWLFAMAGAAALAIALVWLGERSLLDPRTPQFHVATLETTPAADLSEFFQLPIRKQLAVRLDVQHPTSRFHRGDIAHATFHLSEPGAVFVLRRERNGATRLVFPADLAGSANSPAGDTAFSFDPVLPTGDVPSIQPVTLRIIVLPPGLDIRNQPVKWSTVHRYSVQETTYEVAP